EAPYLYKMNVELLLNGKTVDHYGPVTFGFREIWTEGNTLMFNGHPQRFRLEWTACGNTSEGGLSMQRMIGRNTFYFQANPAKWWAVWSETPYYKDDLLDRMDRDGLAILMDAPSVNGVCGKLVNEPATQRDYRREMDLWFRRYRNHPSIVAWTIGMNSFNPRNALHAQTMGIRSEHTHIKARTIEKGYEIAKSLDPTRLVYSHADGNLGDIATGNLYLNFAQLQERMEWPSRWAKQGDMPYVAAEWGSPYTENFYKGKQLLFTEYAAAYFGPAAYEKETDEALNKKVLQNYPVYWDFQKLFVTRTERAWRTWGVQGWHNWNYHIGMGDPPGWKGKSVWNQYASLNQKLEDKPDWANPNWDIHAAVTQPLLVYIAGGETHTDLTHGYYAGEKIKKNVAVVWDGPGTNEMNCTLSLRDGDKVLWSEKKNTTLGAGEIKQVPFVIPAPGVSKRSEFTIVLKGSDKKGVTISDRFEVQVFPRADALEMPQGIVLWDTKGRTRADLDKAGIFVPEWKPDRSLAGVKLLLVGRETMKKGIKLPYTPADLARGLKVVVLEQLPEMWEGLGFSCIETMPRYTFATGKELMNGLAPEDLINWRGSPDLLPEKKNYRSHDAMHVRKWTNRHGVASTIMKIPDAAGFVPLVVADFDLSYSPLLEWRHGTGRVIFSSMDFSGRIGVDPAATRLFANLMKYAVTPVARTRKVYHTGGDKIAELLEVLGVSSAKYTGKVDPRASLVVCGPESKTDLSKFAAGGGRVVTIGVSKQELEMQGFSGEAEEVHRVGTDGMDAIKGLAPNLLRWRDKLNLALFSKDWQPEESNVICGGLMLRRKLGKGEIYFLQAAPWMLEERCKQGNKEREAVLLSIARLYQLAGLVMTQAGAEAGPEQAGRICSIKAGMSYETLGHWHVLGPFFGDPNDAGKALAEVFPGEKNAVAGDTNPNLTYTRADGQTLNFRKTVTARPDGFVDLAKAVGVTENAPIIYVTKRVNSDKARTARLRLGVDYWMKVWVNSEVVYLLDHSQKCAPRPNRHLVDVKLKKGENIFTIKVRSGSKGSGFWANLSTGEGAADDEEQEQVYSLYRNELKLRDPYEYSYW
ncbi:MAG: hypothetical protein K9N51_12850, partial [Candidatus Pacebacteria bacterium]|nr:hypothetical protein [Candidatus Paceibacterota bacterium]